MLDEGDRLLLSRNNDGSSEVTISPDGWVDWAVKNDLGRNGGSFTGGPPKICLHTTETRGWPGYQGGATAPHLTVMALPMERKLVAKQQTSLNVAARALRNEDGGVQTNRDTVYQWELVGTCDPAYAAKYPDAYKWYDADDWALDQLSVMIANVAVVKGVLLQAPVFLPYPSSYGNKNGQRFSLSQWDNFNGVCGHQHVPENVHGDPGSLNVARMLGQAVPDPISIVVPPVPVNRTPEIQTMPAPAFPLGRCSRHGVQAYYGPKSGPDHSHSGYYGATDRNNIRSFQARLKDRGWKRMDVDGLYGPVTADLTCQFQDDKRLGVDGLIGPATWRAAWEAA